MKNLWKLFIASSFIACLIASAVGAIINDYEKATYFLLLAVFIRKDWE